MPVSLAVGAADAAPRRAFGSRALLIFALLLAATVGSGVIWRALHKRPPAAVPPSAARHLTPPTTAAKPSAPAPAHVRAPVADTPAVTLADLQNLKERVEAANRAQTDAIYQGAPDTRALSAELTARIEALGKALYRYHVTQGLGDLEQARLDMRLFLSGINWKGLGLSAEAVELGVSAVAP